MVSINEFLSLYSSKSTLKSYTYTLKHFFGFIGEEPDHYFDAYKKAKTLAKRDKALDKIMLDVTRWLKYLEKVEIIVHRNKKRIGKPSLLPCHSHMRYHSSSSG